MTPSITDLSSLSPAERAKKLQQFAFDQQRQWLTMQYAKDEYFEVRILKNPESKGFLADYYGYFQNTEESIDILIKLLPKYNKAYGIYTTLNPVMPIIKNRSFNKFSKALKNAATQDSEIEQKNWIGIDCDPTRPTGIGSTKEQHDLAIDKAKIIIIDLMQFYKVPAQSIVLADSGNGAHINIKVNQTVNQLPPATVQNMLLFLSAKYSDKQIKIDTSVYNNSRIWKLYGTVARKGDHSEETPHRLSYIIDAPERGTLVNCPLSIIQQLASLAPKKESRATNPATIEENKKDNQSKQSNQANTPHNDNSKRSSTTNSSNHYKRAQAYIDKIDGGVQGNNGSGVAYNVACVLVHGFPKLFHNDRLNLFKNWNEKCTPPFSEVELAHKLASAEKNGSYPVVEDKPLPNKKSGKKQQSTSQAKEQKQETVDQQTPLDILSATADKFGLLLTGNHLECPIHTMVNPAIITINIYDHGIGALTCDGGTDGIIHNNIEIMAKLGLKHGSLNYKKEDKKEDSKDNQDNKDSVPPNAPSNVVNKDSGFSIYTDTQLSDQYIQATEAIIAMNNPPTIFIKNGILSRLNKSVFGTKTELCSEDIMYGMVVRCATWLRSGKYEDKPSKPSRDIAKDMIAIPDTRIPELIGVTQTPCLIGDSILTEPGYDSASKVYYAPLNKIVIPAIKASPTIDDVNAAKSFIFDELLGDFCFETPNNGSLTIDSINAERANYMALMLTPFLKYIYRGRSPMFLIDAPVQGSGKSKLATIIGLIALGIEPVIKSFPEDEAERRKTITSTLIESKEILVFDNMSGLLKSDSLATAITSKVLSDRILGMTKDTNLLNDLLLIGTSNNLTLTSDFARRILYVRLDTGREKPWMREPNEFKHAEIEQWTVDNRPDIIAAILTLINYWRSQGKPLSTSLMSSFESWSSVVGGILQCCGIEEFMGNVEKNFELFNAANDPWFEFVEQWWADYESSPQLPVILNDMCRRHNLLPSVRGSKPSYEVEALARKLAKFNGKIFGGLKITQTKVTINRSGGRPAYSLVKVAQTKTRESAQVCAQNSWQTKDLTTAQTAQTLSSSHIVKNDILSPKNDDISIDKNIEYSIYIGEKESAQSARDTNPLLTITSTRRLTNSETAQSAQVQPYNNTLSFPQSLSLIKNWQTSNIIKALPFRLSLLSGQQLISPQSKISLTLRQIDDSLGEEKLSLQLELIEYVEFIQTYLAENEIKP